VFKYKKGTLESTPDKVMEIHNPHHLPPKMDLPIRVKSNARRALILQINQLGKISSFQFLN